ncbi:MAG TPA: hypothetical protein VGE21_06640 [Flavobacteriales bacterium]
MAAPRKRTKSTKVDKGTSPHEVNEPQAVYTRKSPQRKATKRTKHKGYDAKKSSGMIPGIAERMKEYLKTMRDDR